MTAIYIGIRRLAHDICENPTNLEVNLETIYNTLSRREFYLGLERHHAISLIELLGFVKVVVIMDSLIRSKFTTAQLLILAHFTDCQDIYKYSIEEWIFGVLPHNISPQVNNFCRVFLSDFYYMTQQYDQFLQYCIPDLISDKSKLAIASVRSSQFDADQAAASLISDSSLDNLKRFVLEVGTTQWEQMIQVLDKVYKHQDRTQPVRDYIDRVVMAACTTPERISYIVDIGYFSCQVFSQMALYMSIPHNGGSQTQATSILNRLRSVPALEDKYQSLVDLCEVLLKRNLEGIIEIINKPIFLTLMPGQRASIYVTAYTIQAATDIHAAILFLIQAIVVQDGLGPAEKLGHYVDIIRYFAGTEGFHTYRFYLREFITLVDPRQDTVKIDQVLDICLDKKDYEMADIMEEILGDRREPANRLEIIRSLYDSDKSGKRQVVDISTSDSEITSPKRPRSHCRPCGRDYVDIAVHEATQAHVSRIERYCFTCERGFGSRISLESHLLECGKGDEQPYYCHTCSRGYVNEQTLNCHFTSKLHRRLVESGKFVKNL